MDDFRPRSRFDAVFWALFVLASLAALAWAAPHLRRPADSVLYAASWVSCIHVVLGATAAAFWLGIPGPLQRALFALALPPLVVALSHPGNQLVWSAGMFLFLALALGNYIVLARAPHASPHARAYARLKLRSEGPLLPLLLLMVVLAATKPGAALFSAWATLAVTTALAVWLVAIRRIYARLRTAAEALPGTRDRVT